MGSVVYSIFKDDQFLDDHKNKGCCCFYFLEDLFNRGKVKDYKFTFHCVTNLEENIVNWCLDNISNLGFSFETKKISEHQYDLTVEINNSKNYLHLLSLLCFLRYLNKAEDSLSLRVKWAFDKAKENNWDTIKDSNNFLILFNFLHHAKDIGIFNCNHTFMSQFGTYSQSIYKFIDEENIHKNIEEHKGRNIGLDKVFVDKDKQSISAADSKSLFELINGPDLNAAAEKFLELSKI